MEYFCFLFELQFFEFEFYIEVTCLLVIKLCSWGERIRV